MEKTLPKSWRIVRLGEVCLINPPKPEISNESDVTFLPMDAINDDGDILYKVTRQYKEVKNGYTGFVENDVLFAKITPCMENGKGTIAKDLVNSIGFGSTEFHVIRASEKIIPEVIFRYLSLKNIRKIAEVNMVGSAGQKRVPQSFLNTLQIPLPPLPTQHKIVEILEEADNLRKLRKQADQKMKDLIPSLFVEMFGDPTTNPKGWEVRKLGEVCEIKSGGTPSRNKKEYWNGNIPWLGSTVCKDEPVYKSEEFITSSGLENSAAKIFKPKTTLIALVGATIGKTAFLTFEAATNQNIVGIFPLNRNSLLPEFIFHFSQTLYSQFLNLGEEKFRMANLSFIRNLTIPLPPLPIQQEFAEHVREIEAEKERQAESKKKLDELFNSLMQRAFNGELVA